MSVRTEKPDVPSRGAFINLLKEYSDDLRALVAEAHNIYDKFYNAEDLRQQQLYRQVLIALKHRFDTQLPILVKLSRRVSQYLQHAEIEEMERIELEARLGYLEATTKYASEALKTLTNTKLG